MFWMSCHIECIGMVSLLCESRHVASNHSSFECLFTLSALVWFLSFMNLVMLLQITHVLNVLSNWVHFYGSSPVWISPCCFKSLIFWLSCHIECIGMVSLLCESCPVASNHSCFECLVTLGALVWFLSCVNLVMLIQITDVLNVFSHCVQWYGFFPVLISSCCFKSLIFNLLSHWVHWYGFSPVWISSGCFKSLMFCVS